MTELYSNLKLKGWTFEEIKKAADILEGAKEKKTKFMAFLDATVYWFVLMIAIMANMVLAIILVPFLLVFPAAPLYVLVVSLGLTFGLIFNTILKDLAELEKKEHLVAGIFIPAIALINVFYMVSFSNHLAQTIRINEITHNPVIVSVFYVVAFTIPYLINKFLRK